MRGERPLDQIRRGWTRARPGQPSAAPLGPSHQPQLAHELGDRAIRDLPALLAQLVHFWRRSRPAAWLAAEQAGLHQAHGARPPHARCAPPLTQSVRDDVEVIRSSPLIPDDITVTGFIYDVKTGRIHEVA